MMSFPISRFLDFSILDWRAFCPLVIYKGMLPCFFGGLLWFLLRDISRA